MRSLISIFSVLLLGLFLAGAGSALAADDSSWNSALHLAQATEIPGKMLEPGDYVVRVLDTKQPRKIVQFTNADGTKVIATVMAVPDYKVKAVQNVEFTYFQRAEGAPMALKEWFYVGNNYGVEFVYPKNEAYKIAQSTHETVVMTPSESSEEVRQVTPEQKEEPYEVRKVEETPAPTPAPTTVAENTAPKQLPQTGSELPATALAGMLLLAGAATMRLFRQV
jgi:LPXTG-motif cell wall-anchored protein